MFATIFNAICLTEYGSEPYKPCESATSTNPGSVTTVPLSVSIKEDQLSEEESYGDEMQPQMVCVSCVEGQMTFYPSNSGLSWSYVLTCDCVTKYSTVCMYHWLCIVLCWGGFSTTSCLNF